MAWKPKTIAGKILKGSVIAGGSVVGLIAGTSIVGKLLARINPQTGTPEVQKGTTALSGVGKTILGGMGRTFNTLKTSAGNLISGITADQRKLIKDQKAETRLYQEKLTTIDKLVRAGSTPADARAKVGLEPAELTSYEGETIQQSGIFDLLQNKNTLYIIAGLAGLYLLSKRRRR